MDGDRSGKEVLPEDHEIAIRVLQLEQRDDTRLAPDRGEFRQRVAQPLACSLDIRNTEAEPDRRTSLRPVSARDDAHSDLRSAVQDPLQRAIVRTEVRTTTKDDAVERQRAAQINDWQIGGDTDDVHRTIVLGVRYAQLRPGDCAELARAWPSSRPGRDATLEGYVAVLLRGELVALGAEHPQRLGDVAAGV